MAQLGFDASQVAPDAGQMGALPAGWVVVAMTASEIVPTQAEGGARLKVTLDVLEPEWAKGRKVFEGFNIRNANPVAQEIAYKQLSAVCHAVGILQVQDSEQLHGRPMKVKLKVVPPVYEDDGVTVKYADKNEVVAWKPVNEAVELIKQPASGGAPAGNQQPQGGYQQQQPQGNFQQQPNNGGQMQQGNFQQPNGQMQQPQGQQNFQQGNQGNFQQQQPQGQQNFQQQPNGQQQNMQQHPQGQQNMQQGQQNFQAQQPWEQGQQQNMQQGNFQQQNGQQNGGSPNQGGQGGFDPSQQQYPQGNPNGQVQQQNVQQQAVNQQPDQAAQTAGQATPPWHKPQGQQ